MVDENRTLVFNDSELQDALCGYASATGRDLPSGKVRHVKVQRVPELSARLLFASEGDPEANFTEHEIAVALIHYCKRQQIPISRRGRKSISAADGAVCLSISLKS